MLSTVSFIQTAGLVSDLILFPIVSSSTHLDHITNWASAGTVNREKIMDRMIRHAVEWSNLRPHFRLSHEEYHFRGGARPAFSLLSTTSSLQRESMLAFIKERYLKNTPHADDLIKKLASDLNQYVEQHELSTFQRLFLYEIANSRPLHHVGGTWTALRTQLRGALHGSDLLVDGALNILREAVEDYRQERAPDVLVLLAKIACQELAVTTCPEWITTIFQGEKFTQYLKANVSVDEHTSSDAKPESTLSISGEEVDVSGRRMRMTTDPRLVEV